MFFRKFQVLAAPCSKSATVGKSPVVVDFDWDPKLVDLMLTVVVCLKISLNRADPKIVFKRKWFMWFWACLVFFESDLKGNNTWLLMILENAFEIHVFFTLLMICVWFWRESKIRVSDADEFSSVVDPKMKLSC